MKENATIAEVIENLEKSSIVLEKAANNPKNYNSEFSHYLDMVSFEMRKQASELRECEYQMGGLL